MKFVEVKVYTFNGPEAGKFVSVFINPDLIQGVGSCTRLEDKEIITALEMSNGTFYTNISVFDLIKLLGGAIQYLHADE